MNRWISRGVCLFLLLTAGMVAGAWAQQTPAPGPIPQPTNPAGVDLLGQMRQAAEPANVSSSMMIVLLITVITLAPSILVMTTSFTRIIVVLGFLRQAMATQQTPPNQVLVGLSLILTFFVMTPTYRQVNERAVQPYIARQISQEQALTEAMKPIREFMFRQTRVEDLRTFLTIAKQGAPQTPDDVPTTVLVPAFVVSEMTTAFYMGFIIYIPFLIIDMVVASTLMAMGMMMLPPVFVSLPFKIVMFVLADGWNLLIGSLARSFR